MKWIKLFEGYLDEYYHKITRIDFEAYQFGKDNDVNKRVDFDSELMDNIGSSLNKGFNFDRLYLGSIERGYCAIYGMTISGDRESISIIQLEDDWFLVKQLVLYDSLFHYRCDHVEGLKKFLKDKNIIK